MFDFDGEMEYFGQRSMRAGQALNFLKTHKAILSQCPFKVDGLANPAARMVIKSLKDLDRARNILRQIYGQWNDRYAYVFQSDGKAIAVWENKDNESMEIWLECKIEDFPEELSGDNCKFVKRVETTETYDYVCQVKEG